MRTRILGSALAACLLASAGPASAGDPAPTAAPEERAIRSEAVIQAPVEAVWKAFTTKEGLESWMVPAALVDLRVGGTIRTSYDAQAKPDGPGWITHHVLSYESLRMISTRFDAPPSAPPAARKGQEAWTVTTFEPLEDGRTRVRTAMLGFGSGPEWDAAYAFFEQGNARILDALRKRFPDARASTHGILDDLRALVGTWSAWASHDEPGKPAASLEGRKPDGRVTVSEGPPLPGRGPSYVLTCESATGSSEPLGWKTYVFWQDAARAKWWGLSLSDPVEGALAGSLHPGNDGIHWAGVARPEEERLGEGVGEALSLDVSRANPGAAPTARMEIVEGCIGRSYDLRREPPKGTKPPR